MIGIVIPVAAPDAWSGLAQMFPVVTYPGADAVDTDRIATLGFRTVDAVCSAMIGIRLGVAGISAEMPVGRTLNAALVVYASRFTAGWRRTIRTGRPAVIRIVILTAGEAARFTAEMQTHTAGGAAVVVDAGGLTEQGGFTHHTARSAILRIVVGMTRQIARFTAEVGAGVTGCAAAAVNACR